MNDKPWVARAMALALLVPAASACNKQDKTDETIEVKAEAPVVAPTTITITPQGGSQVMGDLTATHDADKTIVRLNLTGLTEGKSYEAKIRYGDCTMAIKYLADVDEPGEIDKDKPASGGAVDSGALAAGPHDVGDVLAKIDLDQGGTTATGSADVDNDDLGPAEAAFVIVTEDMGVGKDNTLVGCADLSGHGDMGAGMSAPGAAAPGEALPEKK